MLSRKSLILLIWMQKCLMMIVIISGREHSGELHDELLSNDAIDFELKIPTECEEIGICEYVPNYPQEYVSKIIATLPSKGIQLTHDVQRWEEDEKDLCHTVPEVIFPKAVRDKYNNWHLALNSVEVPQIIIGRKCKPTCSNCSALVHFDSDYYGSCDQRYMPRKIIALDLSMKNVITITTPVASCCTCVAKKEDYKED